MPVFSTRIVLDCFYLLIFYSEKFSTEVCRLPYAVNVNLNLSIVSQRSTATTSMLFWYSFATSVIVVFIKLIYSLSDKKDVFNFQKPGPLGLVLFAKWSVIKEWSVL